MKFTKMQGLGNDYVYVSRFTEQVADPSGLARRVSDRHFSVGSDGLILIGPSEVADFRMEMFNADGSAGEMCGNGIRCVGKYVYDFGLTNRDCVTVETGAGIKTLLLTVTDGLVSRVRVDMGRPVLTPSQIPVSLTGDRAVDAPIRAAGRDWRFTAVSMGNPHAIVFLDDAAPGALDALDLAAIGPSFEHHDLFPSRINTEFVRVIDRRTAQMRVWERGSGETMACGTGACAVVVAAVVNGLMEPRATVRLLGGDLEIEWDREADTVYMTGPAVTVFTGELENVDA